MNPDRPEDEETRFFREQERFELAWKAFAWFAQITFYGLTLYGLVKFIKWAWEN